MGKNVHLKVTAQSLALLGYWPLNIKNKFLALLYGIYYKFTITIFVVFVLTQFVEIYMVRSKGLEEISSLMAINFLYTLGLAQIWVIGGPTVKRLIKKIQVTEKNIQLENGDRESANIFNGYVEKNCRLNRVILFLGVICYFMFNLTPPFTELINPPTVYLDVIDNHTIVYRERPLPLVSWFPFDRNKYYKTAFTWHAIAGCVNTAYIVACKNVFFSLMIFVEGQIKILQHKLKTFDKDIPRMQEKALAENLHKAVIYHNAIIKYVSELDDSMRYFLLMDCISCAMEIAMIGFQIAVADISFQLLKNIIYMGSMMTQLCLFYWRGNEILLESTKLSDAIWESGWYTSNPKIRKILLQIMMKAHKPLKLSVGSFFYMSTLTMMTIIRSGYSYATIMRQFHTRK